MPSKWISEASVEYWRRWRTLLNRHFFLGFKRAIEQPQLDGKSSGRRCHLPCDGLKISDVPGLVPQALPHHERNHRAIALGQQHAETRVAKEPGGRKRLAQRFGIRFGG